MSSTLEIAGVTFPTVALICPPDDDKDDSTEIDRTLGYVPADKMRFIPAENGVLFCVEPQGQGLLRFSMSTLACKWIEHSAGDGCWLPQTVTLLDGQLVCCDDPLIGTWYWDHAEKEWVAETITRLSTKPFTQPEGPTCRMVSRMAVLEGDMP